MEKSIFGSENRHVVQLLRDYRAKSGMTQVELAHKLNVTQSYVSKIERGERVLDIIQLRVICHCLGTTLPDFVAQLEARLHRRRNK